MALEFHPAADKYPLLQGDEYEALKESIKLADGVRYPILTYHGKILDGRNRYRACLELGLQPRLKEFGGTEHEAQELVNDLNLYRRHLDPEIVREIVAAILKENPSYSDRLICKISGSSRGTVQRIREEIKDNTDTEQSAGCPGEHPAEELGSTKNDVKANFRIGLDGKMYPAKHGTKANLKNMQEMGKMGKGIYAEVQMWPVANIKAFIKHVESGVPVLEARKLVEESAVEPGVDMQDQIGLPIPANQRASFSLRTKFEEIRGLLVHANRLIKDAAAMKGGEHLQHALKADLTGGHLSYRLVELDQAIQIVKNSEPFASICPWCLNGVEAPKGGCDACRHDGWVTENQWIRAGHDMQMVAMAKAQRKAERAAGSAPAPMANGQLARSVVAKLEEEIAAANSESGLAKRAEHLESVKAEIGPEYERLSSLIEAKRRKAEPVTAS